jgi:hypothetical protein
MPPPTLRERVREALAAREPTATEARDDLDAILRRQETSTSSRAPFQTLAIVFLAIGVALGAFSLLRGSSPEIARLPPGRSLDGAVIASRGVHLYLRRSGEPESQALVIDLDTTKAP